MQNQMMGGLLGAAAPQQQPAMGGLLGQQPAAPAGQDQSLQMAQQLAQNPTPEMGQQIVAQMRQAGMPEADQIAQFLAQVGNDTAKIKEVAMQVVQALSSQ